MKWTQPHNSLIQAIVIGMEALLLCGIVFELFYEMTDHTSWGKALNAPKMQIVLTLMLCYVLCGMQRSVLLYKRLVYAYQIVTVVCWNIVSFAVLAGGVLAIGRYMDVWSYFFAGYLLALWGHHVGLPVGSPFLGQANQVGRERPENDGFWSAAAKSVSSYTTN